MLKRQKQSNKIDRTENPAVGTIQFYFEILSKKRQSNYIYTREQKHTYSRWSISRGSALLDEEYFRVKEKQLFLKRATCLPNNEQPTERHDSETLPLQLQVSLDYTATVNQ